MDEPLSTAEYRAAVTGVVVCARVLNQFDIPKLLEAIERADSFGCFFDPTLWINNRGKMNEDREVLEAALPLWRLAKKLQAMNEAAAAAQPTQ